MRVFFATACLVLGLLPAAGHAVDETEYTLKKEFDRVLPIFMTGHPGDLAWIEGFSFDGTIYLGAAAIGSVTGEATLWNPPMNMQEAYDQVSMRITNSIAGVGSFEVYAQGVSLGSSTSATLGDHIISWSGSLTNGTGLFDGYYGLSSGMVQANLNTGAASATEILLVRPQF